MAKRAPGLAITHECRASGAPRRCENVRHLWNLGTSRWRLEPAIPGRRWSWTSGASATLESIFEGERVRLPAACAIGPRPAKVALRQGRRPHWIQPLVVVDQDASGHGLQPDLDAAGPTCPGSRPAHPQVSAIHERCEHQVRPPLLPTTRVVHDTSKLVRAGKDERLVHQLERGHDPRMSSVRGSVSSPPRTRGRHDRGHHGRLFPNQMAYRKNGSRTKFHLEQ